mmetsp:Transcript_29137/g.28200  ORF Transcript_29137/g.28200 Transcript_29137/m.28200 type:complete len:339 (-) Transcript_29137:570-1586(-)
MPSISNPEDGGSSITSYNLQYDQGTGNYITLVGEIPDNLVTTFTRAGLASNILYSFKYRVKNKFGWSDFSDPVSILAASKPNQVSSVTFSQVSDTYVRISWTAPYNEGNPITSYSVLIEDTGGSDFYPEITDCDGSDPTIASLRYCDIPMTTFMGSPFFLALNELIVVKVAAINSIDTGDYSTPNVAGIYVQTKPVTPTLAPILGSYDETSATITLTPLTGLDAGMSTITQYELLYDAGTLGVTWSTYTLTTSTTISVSGLSSGSTYKFKYAAKNVFGWSPSYSPELTMKAMVIPDAPDMVVTTMDIGDPTKVKISWAEPYTGGTAITIDSYDILIKK